MFSIADLFQWERFITPSIIRLFYWLAMIVTLLVGLSGVFSALALMAVNLFAGFVTLVASLAGIVLGILFVRIAAEFILIVFRINEHLGAIRHGQSQ